MPLTKDYLNHSCPYSRYAASLSSMLSPVLSSRLKAGKLALDARVIVANTVAYPAIIGGVIQSTVIVLGSRYTGEGTACSIATYLLFVRRLVVFTVIAALGGLGLLLWLGANHLYGLFTTSEATVALCNTVTPVVLASVVLNILGSVVLHYCEA